jgi:alanyl-tRNA synthetase
MTRAKGRSRPEIPAAIVAVAVSDGKVALIAGASPEAIDAGVTANGLLQAALPLIGGRGGGKDDVAQGGGTEPEGVPAALSAVEEYVRRQTGG